MAFTWERTRPDIRYDFIASEDGEQVGRIHRLSGGPQDKWWFWSCTGCQRGVEAAEVSPRHGVVETRGEAIAALAEVWVKAKAWSADRVAAGDGQPMIDEQKSYLHTQADLRSWHRWQIKQAVSDARAM